MAGVHAQTYVTGLAAGGTKFDSFLQACKSLTEEDPGQLLERNGFTIALKPGQILLTPPGYILIDVPLSENSTCLFWQWLVPSHLDEEAPVAQSVAGLINAEIRATDDEAPVRVLQKTLAKIKLGAGLYKWFSNAMTEQMLQSHKACPCSIDMDKFIQEVATTKKLEKSLIKMQKMLEDQVDKSTHMDIFKLLDRVKVAETTRDSICAMLRPSLRTREAVPGELPTHSIGVVGGRDILYGFLQRCSSWKKENPQPKAKCKGAAAAKTKVSKETEAEFESEALALLASVAAGETSGGAPAAVEPEAAAAAEIEEPPTAAAAEVEKVEESAGVDAAVEPNSSDAPPAKEPDEVKVAQESSDATPERKESLPETEAEKAIETAPAPESKES